MFTNILPFQGMFCTKVERGHFYDSDCIDFTMQDGTIYRMTHVQDCCESVYIEDICGELCDLENTIINVAEYRYSEDDNLEDGVGTWTFYEFRTIKGSVTVRWYGHSNGYYSTTAEVYNLKEMLEWMF